MIEFEKLPDYAWLENGQSVLSGALLKLYQRLDRLFLDWAAESVAQEYLFPPFIPARELAKLDYFRSFPHLVTFPVALDTDPDNLQRFIAGEPLDSHGEVQLTLRSPIREALTPAACYHFYIQFQNKTLSGPRYLTTRASCFRREVHYSPLQRQCSFSMREIVCIGTAEEVKNFLAQYRERLTRFFERINLSIEWMEATDPFFNPSRNPKFLLQKLDPVKTEMVFEGHLAIGSINFHRNYFGESFQISREGKEAFSGCVAFGIERWIYAFLVRYGTHEAEWPDFD